jgi:hypothetical protein
MSAYLRRMDLTETLSNKCGCVSQCFDARPEFGDIAASRKFLRGSSGMTFVDPNVTGTPTFALLDPARLAQ